MPDSDKPFLAKFALWDNVQGHLIRYDDAIWQSLQTRRARAKQDKERYAVTTQREFLNRGGGRGDQTSQPASQPGGRELRTQVYETYEWRDNIRAFLLIVPPRMNRQQTGNCRLDPNGEWSRRRLWITFGKVGRPRSFVRRRPRNSWKETRDKLDFLSSIDLIVTREKCAKWREACLHLYGNRYIKHNFSILDWRIVV